MSEAKRAVRIFENDLQREEFARTVYILRAPSGTTPEDYLEVETYAHVGMKLRPNDEIKIVAEDRTWLAEIFVVACEGPLIQVEMLRKHHFVPIVGKEYDAYDVNWGGPSAKWRVVRKSDREVMVDKLGQKSEALAWVEDHAKPLKAAA